MRRIIFYAHISLDGFFSGPDGELDHFVPSDEVHQHANDYLRDADALIMGRVMYDVMSFWDGVDPSDLPRVQREFAEIYQSTPRYVMSRSRPQLDAKSTLITGDIVSRVRQLKDDGDGYLGLGVGPELLAMFLENGLIDEMMVIVMPMLLGEGVPLFRDVKGHLPLKLTSTRTFEGGSVLHAYSAGEKLRSVEP